VGEAPVPSAFFFLNLFLHIALPVGLLLVLWLHVTRVARPVLLPPREVLWGGCGGLLVLSLLAPVMMAPEADLLTVPGRAPVDLFYLFFLPFTERLSAGWIWLWGSVLVAGLVLVPVATRPRAAAWPEPSVVNERSCTGCEQCYHDCPYDAITMVAREDDRGTLVARVDPSYCVSCGICAGSCAPMALGPPGRTGRDQRAEARAFVAAREGVGGRIVLVGCSRSACGEAPELDGSPVFGVACAGSLHTSTVEQFLRSGAAGVLVVSCPPADCWNREGSRWVRERLFEGREAELKERVDRRRVRLVQGGALEVARLRGELRSFGAHLAGLADSPTLPLVPRQRRQRLEAGPGPAPDPVGGARGEEAAL
jgi:ferredoxin